MLPVDWGSRSNTARKPATEMGIRRVGAEEPGKGHRRIATWHGERGLGAVPGTKQYADNAPTPPGPQSRNQAEAQRQQFCVRRRRHPNVRAMTRKPPEVAFLRRKNRETAFRVVRHCRVRKTGGLLDPSPLPMPPNKVERAHHSRFHSTRWRALRQTWFFVRPHRLPQQLPGLAIRLVSGGWEIGVEQDGCFGASSVRRANQKARASHAASIPTLRKSWRGYPQLCMKLCLTEGNETQRT